jgi:hypothetical protein
MIMYQIKHEHGGYSGAFFEATFGQRALDGFIQTDMNTIEAATELANLRSRCQQQEVILKIAESDKNIIRSSRDAFIKSHTQLLQEIIELHADVKNGTTQLDAVRDVLERMIEEYVETEE